MANPEKDLRGVDDAEAQKLLADLRDQIAEVYWRLNDQDYAMQKSWMDHLCWSITKLMGDESEGWEEDDKLKYNHEAIEALFQSSAELTHDEYYNLDQDLLM